MNPYEAELRRHQAGIKAARDENDRQVSEEAKVLASRYLMVSIRLVRLGLAGFPPHLAGLTQLEYIEAAEKACDVMEMS